MNPFRLVEKIGIALGYTILALICLAILTLFVYGFGVHEGWGWWALLLIPGIPLAIIATGLVLGLIGAGFEAIGKWWRRATRRWDASHGPRKG